MSVSLTNIPFDIENLIMKYLIHKNVYLFIPLDFTQEDLENELFLNLNNTRYLLYPNLKTLLITHNKYITEIPYIETLEYLKLESCPKIHSIASYPILKSLSIENCLMLDKIPTQKSLVFLHLHKSKIETLPKLSLLEHLVCINCPNLIINSLPNLRQVNSFNCPNLYNL